MELPLSTDSVPCSFFPRVAISCRLSLKIDRNYGGAIIGGYMIWFAVNRRYGIWIEYLSRSVTATAVHAHSVIQGMMLPACRPSGAGMCTQYCTLWHADTWHCWSAASRLVVRILHFLIRRQCSDRVCIMFAGFCLRWKAVLDYLFSHKFSQLLCSMKVIKWSVNAVNVFAW